MAEPIKHYNNWRIRWVDEFGTRRSETYDNEATAAFKLREHELHVEAVKLGSRVGLVPNKKFSDLCDYWLEKKAHQKRSGRSDRSIIDQHLKPAFGEMYLRDFDESHVDWYGATKLEVSQKTLFNHLTLLGTMLKLAARLRWMLREPKISKPKISIYSSEFRYLKDDEEIARFLAAAAATDPIVHLVYAAAIYTGMREGELAGLRWPDIDFQRRLIVVQRSFKGPTKGGSIRYVPILDPLLPLLRDWKLRWPGPVVFPNKAGRMHCPSSRIFQEVLHRVLKRGNFPLVEIEGRMRHYIRFHDLRHTFASHWVMRGGDIFKLQKILGHQDIKMTLRYAHLAPDAFSADYQRLGSWAPGLATPIGDIRLV